MRKLPTLTAVAALVAFAIAPAAGAAEIDCELRFTTSGWSAFYKTAKGSGTISCTNGQRLNVAIRAKGGGLTFGKSTIDNGVGEFSGVHDIDELVGTYAAAEAHAGAASRPPDAPPPSDAGTSRPNQKPATSVGV